MNQLNNDIPGFLGEKLSNATSPVDPSLWQNIADKLPTQTPASGAESVAGSSAPGMSVAAKIAIWSGAAVLTGVAGYGIFALLTEEKAPSAPQVEAPETVIQPETDVNYEDVVVAEPEEHPAGEAEAAPKTASQQPQQAQQQVPAAKAAPSEPTEAGEMPLSIPEETSPAEPVETATATSSERTESAETNQNSPAQTETLVSPHASADFNVAFDATDELLASFSAEWQDGDRYTWDFGDGNSSEEPNPMHRYDEEGEYLVRLFVADLHGNEVALEASVEVRRTPVLKLPNIFTPNNDGLNDRLHISEDSKHVSVLRLIVFDHQGKVVYEQFGAGSGWDGLLQDGSPAPEATYRLVVTAQGNDGKQYNESSFVRLQR